MGYGGDPNHLLTGMILQVVKDAQQTHVIHVKKLGGVSTLSWQEVEEKEGRLLRLGVAT